jgi:hypothetical protein
VSARDGLLILPFLLINFFCFPLVAQQRVDQRNMHEHFFVAVPMVGGGTFADPRRPLFVPAGNAPVGVKGILSFSYQISDDRTHAIVEFVSRDRLAMAPLLTDTINNLKIFQKGKDSRDDLEAEMRKYKKDFSLDGFAATAVGGGK